MAGIDELSEQLSLTQKINSVIERMALNASKLEQSFAMQNQLFEKMVTQAREFDLSKARNEIDDLARRMKTVADTMSGLGGISDQSVSKVARNAANAASKAKALNEILRQNATSMKDVARTSTFEKVASAVAEAGVGAGGFGRKLRGISEFMQSKFSRSALIAAGALSGLYQGFENVVSISKSVIGTLTQVGKGLFNVGLAILSIPMKIFTGLVDLAANANANWAEFRQALEDVRKEFGDLRGPSSLTLTELIHDMKGFSDTGLSAWRVFGNFAERLNHLREVAAALGAAFDATMHEWVANGGALLGFQKGLGMTSEQLRSVASIAITVGKPMSKFLTDVTKQTTELGEAFGISQKVIGKDMAKAFSDMRHFAQLSVKEIGTASVYARKLGLELDKITGTLDQFETFDNAAESAAKLTQSFGLTVDAFQLMEAQSPAEQIDMLRKSFSRAGVDVSQFNRQQLRLLSSTTGLDEATARQVFSLSNQGASLDDIRKKSEKAEKKQLTQAEAMAKLADSIERLVKQSDQTGSFFDMFMRGVGRGLQSSKDFVGIIHNIKNGLRAVYEVGLELGRALPDIIPGLGQFFSGIREFFKPEKYRAIAQTVSNAVKDYFTGKKTLTGALAGMKDQFVSFFSAQGPVAMKIYEGFKGIFRSLGKLINDAIPYVADGIAKTLTKLTEFIRNPDEFINKLGSTSGEYGFFTGILMDTAKSLAKAWTVIWPPVKSLLLTVFDKVVDFVKTPEVTSALKKAAVAMAGVMFGPVLTQSALGALTSFVFSKATMTKVGDLAKSSISKSPFLKSAAKIAGPVAIAAAAFEIGSSVNKFTDQITTTMDRDEKILAASATGLVNALTLGLLPDDFQLTIANTLGSVTSTLFSVMTSVFGVGFTSNFKRIFSSAFETIGGITSLIKELFTGDQASMERAAADVGKSLLKFGINAIEGVFVQFPIFVADMAGRILNLLGGAYIKIATSAFSTIAEFINKMSFGKIDLRQTVRDVGAAIGGGLNDMTSDFSKVAKESSKAISDASKEFQDKYLATSKQQAETVKSANSMVASAQSDALKSANESLTNKAHELGISSTSLSSVTTMLQDLERLPGQVKKTVKEIQSSGMQPALKAINDMVDQVKKMDEALADGRLNTVNVQTKLRQVANAVGLGGKASYTVQTKPVQITINMNVQMNAEDLEKALVMRSTSIIRERLNFATSNPSDRGDNQILDRPGEQPPLHRSPSS